ncbi:ATP-binding protein [Halorubrum sp. DTA98]|uniref:ATP-binding protein n=1 Tax=Halorubrum sp. DTA98 TaxID=3402163 RepID=UPI003AAF8747
MHVLGREVGASTGRERGPSDERETGSGRSREGTVRLGSFLARDGSAGATVGLDVDGPHAGVVVGKRGTGKSYTLGVVAEGLADAAGVAPVVVDPMGVFGGLEATGGHTIDPVVRPASVPPSAWPELVGLDPERGAGSLLWRVVADAVDGTGVAGTDSDGTEPTDCASPSIAMLREAVERADAAPAARRAAINHLELASSWGVFDADAPRVSALVGDGDPVVLDLSGAPETAAAAVVRAVARGLYDARIADEIDRLPWLLIDEAHAFFGGIADPALRTLLTRGRAPGVSLVCATQRPGVLPPVAISQSDLLVAHRLTAERDVERLADAEATYLAGDLASRLPTGTGEALVVDDATETAHTVRVRERRTPHGGGSPRASETVAARRLGESTLGESTLGESTLGDGGSTGGSID